jgi:hypothetical protein
LETQRVTKRTWQRIGLAAGAALLAYVVVEIVLAGRGLPPLPPTQTGILLSGGHVRGNRITTKSWTFDYKTAQLSADGTTGSIEGVTDGIVFQKGKPHLRISAQEISVNTQTLDFTAIGKVHVELIHDPEKRSFETDLVVWTNGTKLLEMQHPSYLRSRGGQMLKLQDVTIDFATNRIKLGKVSGSFNYTK